MSDERGASRWCYDARGQETAERRTVSGYSSPFDIHYNYDTAGRVQELTYPDGDVVSYQYDDEEWGGLSPGKLFSFASSVSSSIVSGAQYDSAATSGPTQVDFGNGAYTTYDFDTLNRLNNIKTRLSGQTVQDLDYAYWKTDNVKQVVDHVPEPDDNVFYNYDDRGRLVGMQKDSPNGPALASYTYGTGADEGKLVAKDEGGLLSYQFTDANHPHAVTKAGNDTFTYDNNGNIKNRLGGETYTFDAENRLASVASYPTQTDYWYDGAGNMICRATSASAYPGAMDSKTVYIGGIYEATSEYGGAPVITKYYLAFGRVVAQRAGNQTSYYLSDHLGTTAGMMLQDGTVQTSKYYPFGKLRSGGASTDKMYTGQQMEGNSRLGAYFYHARFYSPVLGHFLSADSLTVDGLNRYAYVRNNPLKYSDPTGMCGTGQQYDSLLWNDCNNEPWCGAGDPDCNDQRAIRAGCEENPGAPICTGRCDGLSARQCEVMSYRWDAEQQARATCSMNSGACLCYVSGGSQCPSADPGLPDAGAAADCAKDPLCDHPGKGGQEDIACTSFKKDRSGDDPSTMHGFGPGDAPVTGSGDGCDGSFGAVVCFPERFLTVSCGQALIYLVGGGASVVSGNPAPFAGASAINLGIDAARNDSFNTAADLFTSGASNYGGKISAGAAVASVASSVGQCAAGAIVK